MHFLGNSGQVDRREAPTAVIQMKAASESPLPLPRRCRRRYSQRSSHRSSFFGGPRLALRRRRAKRCPGEAMATRSKKGSGTEGELPKRRTSGKTTSAPRKRVRKVQEEAQIGGTDVVPVAPVTTDQPPSQPLSHLDAPKI